MSDDMFLLIVLIFINVGFTFLTLNGLLFFKEISRMGLGMGARFINTVLVFFSTMLLLYSIICTCTVANRLFF